MAFLTIDVQDNPNRANVGTDASKATVISTVEDGGEVEYQIRRRDRIGGTLVFRSDGISPSDRHPQVVAINYARLKIMLDGRTEYQARARRIDGSSNDWVYQWTNFKTRDTRYQSPDAITKLSDDSTTTAADRGKRVIRVTNSAKATVTNTSKGATVNNSDKQYNSTTSIAYTSRGATVNNSD